MGQVVPELMLTNAPPRKPAIKRMMMAKSVSSTSTYGFLNYLYLISEVLEGF